MDKSADTYCDRTPAGLGITAVSAGFSPELLSRQSQEISERGFGSIRVPVEWPRVEISEGIYDWTYTDKQVDAFAAAGMDILGVLTWAPSWAVSPENRLLLHPAPAEASTFAEFAHQAAARYENQIRTWEIWNEPNIGVAFGPQADVSLYVSMLKSAYLTIKSVDPRLLVITGGTSPSIDNESNLSPPTFVQELYRAGGGDYFDAVAMHLYSGQGLLSDGADQWSSRSMIAQVRDIMAGRGDSNKRIWFTEFGAPTAPGTMTESQQAGFLVDGIAAMRDLPYCGAIFLFDYRDLETGSDIVDFNFGLVRSDFTPKESLSAVLGTS